MVAMAVNYVQSRDFRWKASGPVDGTAQAIANSTGAVGAWIPTATSEGVCLALSVWWIIKNSKGDDFWDWLGPPARACLQRAFGQTAATTVTHGAAKGQNIQMGLARAGDVVAKIQALMRTQKVMGGEQKFELVHETITAQNAALSRQMPDDAHADLLEDLPLGDGYYYISIGNPDFKGKGFYHGTACEIKVGAVRYFDPNIGEADGLKKAELQNFVEHLVYSQYGLPNSSKTLIQAVRFA